MNPDNDTNLIYQLALSRLPGMRLVLAQQILETVPSLSEFFNSDKSRLMEIFGTESKMFDTSLRNKVLDEAKKELEWIKSNNVTPLFYCDEEYPRRLLQCDDSPVMIFVCGKPNFNARHVVSIVGTRKSTPYGSAFTAKLVADLSEKFTDLLIISGLAYGIDVAAHRASQQNNIPTVAVLAHGLNQIYPAQHRNVARDMIRNNGGLVTDYFPDATIHQGNFLARNRIVAAMCDALVVVESASKGGAMFTARLASNYGRDVFALPGRISDIYSEGCNRLIRNNIASVITSADDLIASMMWKPDKTEGEQPSLFADKNLSENEQKVIELIISLGEADVPCISKNHSLTIPQAMRLVSDMEFDGHIMAYPGGFYRLQNALKNY